jgi:hypothetical protein
MDQQALLLTLRLAAVTTAILLPLALVLSAWLARSRSWVAHVVEAGAPLASLHSTAPVPRRGRDRSMFAPFPYLSPLACRGAATGTGWLSASRVGTATAAGEEHMCGIRGTRHSSIICGDTSACRLSARAKSTGGKCASRERYELSTRGTHRRAYNSGLAASASCAR